MPGCFWRGSLLQTKDMCLRARLPQDAIECMFFLLTVGAGHTRVTQCVLTVHKYIDLGVFPIAIPSTEGWCGEIKNGSWNVPSPMKDFCPFSVSSFFFFFFLLKYSCTRVFLNYQCLWAPSAVLHISRKESCGKPTDSSVYTAISLLGMSISPKSSLPSLSSYLMQCNELPSGWANCLSPNSISPAGTRCLLFWQLI